MDDGVGAAKRFQWFQSLQWFQPFKMFKPFNRCAQLKLFKALNKMVPDVPRVQDDWVGFESRVSRFELTQDPEQKQSPIVSNFLAVPIVSVVQADQIVPTGLRSTVQGSMVQGDMNAYKTDRKEILA